MSHWTCVFFQFPPHHLYIYAGNGTMDPSNNFFTKKNQIKQTDNNEIHSEISTKKKKKIDPSTSR